VADRPLPGCVGWGVTRVGFRLGAVAVAVVDAHWHNSSEGAGVHDGLRFVVADVEPFREALHEHDAGGRHFRLDRGDVLERGGERLPTENMPPSVGSAADQWQVPGGLG
jgi:hypothetical protein